MKKLLILVLLTLFLENAIADDGMVEDDCGISTVNIGNQASIISVQVCIKETLTELSKALDEHKTLANKFEKKAKAIKKEEGLCKKFKSYYENSVNDFERGLFKSNTDDCLALLIKRTEYLADFTTSFKKMNDEAKKVRLLVYSLQNKYDMLARQIEFLKQ